MLGKQFVDVACGLGQLALGLGAPGLALSGRLFRWCLALRPDHAQAEGWLTYLQALQALRHGEAEEAIGLLKRTVAALPENLSARANLGIACALSGVYEEAIYNLEEVVRQGLATSRHGDLWAALVWSYLRTGRVPKARDTCWRAAEHQVSTPRLQLLGAMVIGVQAGALPTEMIGKLLRSIPSATPMVLEYAEHLASRGKHLLAEQLIESLPQSAWGQGYRVVAHSALTGLDLQTASWAAERCRRVSGDVVATGILLSEISLRQHRTQDALNQARRAVEADDSSSEAHEQLGKVLLLRGDWAGAVEQMIEALHVGPASALAAGLAALASISAGDFSTARGLFIVERSGDGLGVACAHVAQCRILQHQHHDREALKLAGWAVEEIEQLPAHQRIGPLIERLAQELEFALANLSCTDDADALSQLHQRIAAVSHRQMSISD